MLAWMNIRTLYIRFRFLPDLTFNYVKVARGEVHP